MSPKRSGVPRPLKKGEFEIQFGTSQAQKGWQDLLATKLNSVVDAQSVCLVNVHTNHPNATK